MHDDVTVIISQGYFRDVTKEDLADILPSFANPLEDPIFLIPPKGRPYTLSDEDEPAMRSVAGHQRNGGRPAHQQSLLKDRVSELKAQAAAEVRLEMNEQYPAGEGYHVTEVGGAQLFCLCAILCSSRCTCGCYSGRLSMCGLCALVQSPMPRNEDTPNSETPALDDTVRSRCLINSAIQ